MKGLLAAAVILGLPAIAFSQDADHGGHTVHDRAINFKVLFDQFEAQLVHGEPGSRWDSRSWIGGDRHRLLVRTEGEAVDGILDTAEVQVLYSRAFSPWWEAVAGVRFDARPSPSHTWFAIGVQGLAPQMIDVQATAYIGQSGHLAARLELEHDLHVTQRVVFQPLVELSLSGSDARTAASAPDSARARSGFASVTNSSVSWPRTRAWCGIASCSERATSPATEAATPAAGTWWPV